MIPNTVAAGTTNPCSLSVDPAGRYVYVLSCNHNLGGDRAVVQYTVGANGAPLP